MALILGGTPVSANTGRDHVSLPGDCAGAAGDDVFDGSPPKPEGGFRRDASDFDLDGASSHGASACVAENGDVDLTVAAPLIDRERSSRDMEPYSEEALEELYDVVTPVAGSVVEQIPRTAGREVGSGSGAG